MERCLREVESWAPELGDVRLEVCIGSHLYKYDYETVSGQICKE